MIAVVDAVADQAHALSAAEIACWFKGAKKPEIAAVLEALAALGILFSFDTPDGRRWRAA